MNAANSKPHRRCLVAAMALVLTTFTTGCLPSAGTGTNQASLPSPVDFSNNGLTKGPGLDLSKGPGLDLSKGPGPDLSKGTGLDPSKIAVPEKAPRPLTEMFEDDGPGQTVNLAPTSWNGTPQPWLAGVAAMQQHKAEKSLPSADFIGPPMPSHLIETTTGKFKGACISSGIADVASHLKCPS